MTAQNTSPIDVSSSTTNAATPTRTTWGSPWAWTTATIAVGCLLAVSLLLPTHITTSVERPHSVTFNFDTSSPGTQDDPIYGADGAVYGDPIFLSLSDRLIVSVAVEPDSVEPGRVEPGSVEHLELDAQITSSVGWTQPIATMASNTNEAELALDLPSLIARIEDTEARTGTVGNQTLVITATALSAAAPDSEPLPASDRHPPITSIATVEFSISPTTITVNTPSLGPGPGNETGTDTASLAGRHEVVTMLPAEIMQPRRLGLGAARLPVQQLRILLGASTTVLAAITFRSLIIALLARRRGEEAWLRARYAAYLVPAHPVQPERLQHIAVESFATLLRLSEQLRQSILVAEQTSEITVGDAISSVVPQPAARHARCSRFCVVDGLTAFTYTTAPTPAARSMMAPPTQAPVETTEAVVMS